MQTMCCLIIKIKARKYERLYSVNFYRWSRMSLEEREAYARSIYDIVYLENIISYSQMVIGLWRITEAVASDAQMQEVREMMTLEDAESAVEIFGARYN